MIGGDPGTAAAAGGGGIMAGSGAMFQQHALGEALGSGSRGGAGAAGGMMGFPGSAGGSRTAVAASMVSGQGIAAAGMVGMGGAGMMQQADPAALGSGGWGVEPGAYGGAYGGAFGGAYGGGGGGGGPGVLATGAGMMMQPRSAAPDSSGGMSGDRDRRVRQRLTYGLDSFADNTPDHE